MLDGKEMMMKAALKMFGVDDAVLASVQQIATDGTLQKIMLFADHTDEMLSILRKIAKDYDNVCATCGGTVVEPGPCSAPVNSDIAERPILSIANGTAG